MRNFEFECQLQRTQVGLIFLYCVCVISYIVTCGSNSRHIIFQRHKADDPAKLESEVAVTAAYVCVCLSVWVGVCA